VNLAPVLDVLRRRIGLDPDALGSTSLARTVAARTAELGVAGAAAYAARLDSDPAELQVVLADVAVPETWFFRGGAVFDYLARHVADTVAPRGTRFRALSVPCSTGEEPYSLAIALAEAGVPAEACEIEAVELSAAYLDRARRARFGEFSFRQTPSGLRERYFRPVAGGWELDAAVRARVRFREGNLLDPGLLAGAGPYDLIFCRNLFIYLHREARRHVLDTLLGLLAPEGWLCSGHAEPLDLQDNRCTPTGPPEFFLYRRIPDAVPRVARPESSKGVGAASRLGRLGTPFEDSGRATPRPHPAAFSNSPPMSGPARVAVVPAVTETPPSPDLLACARRHADAGQLDAALAGCRDHLARAGPSADLYSLMGVVHQARGERDEAADCYRRALYLDAGHAEALSHLLLLHEEQGDHAQADRLRRRLARAAGGGDP
jgi:chemotaxis protein methyltransferase WspC